MNRQLLRWRRNKYLKIAKMLAWHIKQHEHPSEKQLWRRMDVLYKPVSMAVAGVGFSWVVIQRHTLQTQGGPKTPSKLMHRADKAERYAEFNEYKEPVVAAYCSVIASVPRAPAVAMGGRRRHEATKPDSGMRAPSTPVLRSRDEERVAFLVNPCEWPATNEEGVRAELVTVAYDARRACTAAAPSNSPRTERSSSTVSQWMPIPRPIKRH